VSGKTTTRRPLKSRGTVWAGYFSRRLLALGLRPNAVSVIGIGFAALAGLAMVSTGRAETVWPLWLAAAVLVQLRLFCNLMDGLLAVEGGLKSPTGELFNELPDRIEDALILVPLGYAGGTEWSVALGWAAACGAIATAYIRAVGAGLTGSHDFRGPMAKPHRMAAVTALCVLLAALDLIKQTNDPIPWGLALINFGIAITCIRRIGRLARHLHSPPP
jgi:phosphatidylglycerophosphate synthase